MKKLMGAFLSVGLAFGIAACNKDEKTTTKTETKTEAKPTGTEVKTDTKTETKPGDKPAGSATAPGTAPAGDKAAPAAGGDIGVAECDDYIKKMNDCAGKMQPEAAGPMKESMATMQKAWKDAAATPEGKTALASGCKQALDAAKSAYASMGCSF
jgi:hypothetical protein